MKTTVATFEALESRRLLSSSPALTSTLSTAGTGLTGEFFVGNDFQTPVVVRTDARINFDWMNGRPDKDLAKNTAFTAQWTGQVQPAVSATYTFYTNANSGTRVLVNGTTIIDNFASRTAGVSTGTIALTAGQKYSIEVQFVSKGKGPARVQLLWSAAGVRKQTVPKSALYPDTTVALPAEALLGTYYIGANFNQEVMTRADPVIKFDWNTLVPDSAIPLGTPFSVQWTGQITATVSGQYTFKTITDDGARLFVNGTEIINDYHVHSVKSDYGKITLTAGQVYDVKMQYFQDGVGHDQAKLKWSLPGSGGAYEFVTFNAPVTVVPAAPVVSATAVSTSQIHLSWNDVTGETGFTVLRSADGGATYTQVGTTAQGVTTFDDTGLTTSTAYEYEIVATSAAGNSPASSPVSATTLGLQPTAVTASATVVATTATISWTASPTATSYLVERSLSATTGFTSIGTTANITLADKALTNATTYFYRVTPSNSVGAGPVSNVVSVTTVPAAPLSLVATPFSESQVNLTWNDVTGETGFIVQESLNGTTGFTQIGSTAAGVTTFPASGLAASTQYFFRVIAVGAGGDSAPSNVASATTSAASPSYSSRTTLYGLTDSSTVYSINPTSGAVTQIGSLAFPTHAGGRDPLTGDLFYVSLGNTTVEVASWDPVTGANHVINTSVSLGNPTAEAAFRDDGQFFLTTDTGQLYAINSTTGAATLKGIITVGGSTLATGTGDIAFAPNGTLFIENSGELYSVTEAAVNAGTGGGSVITATDIGATAGTLQIAFGQSGVLFGETSGGQLYTVDTLTGASTAVGSASGVVLNDLASVPLYADLSVTQSATSLVRGADGAYTFTITNAGPDTTDGQISLVDTLPAGLSFVSGTGTGWSFSQSGQTVTMTYTGTLATGASAPAITLNVAVGSTAASSVTNTLAVSTTIFDTNTVNNSSVLSSPVTG